MNENPFAAAWDRHKDKQDAIEDFGSLEAFNEVNRVLGENQRLVSNLPEPTSVDEEEVFDFDAAQDFDEMMDALKPGRNSYTMRNYAKDRTLAGKKRRKAKRS